MLKIVLFDLDGTLVEERSAAAAAVVEWAAEYGVTGPDVATRWAAVSEKHYRRFQRRELTFPEQRRRRVREFLAVDVSDAEADAMFEGYVWRYEAGWTVYADAVPGLRAVREAGLRAVVLTNGNGDHQRSKLDRLALTDEIDELIAGDTLPVGKPDPRAFAHALERLGADKHDVVMVGNSLENDIRGAQAVGIDAVLVDRDDAQPDADVPRVQELTQLLDVLRRSARRLS
ncbi:HAD family hydrolase [Kribbella sp. NPDC003557]|uniref:HAD family hydrolase n=1 Tax=Kribbella sp. NPDC003557 TaxID=3154449 RepID=UPI0033BEA127